MTKIDLEEPCRITDRAYLGHPNKNRNDGRTIAKERRQTKCKICLRTSRTLSKLMKCSYDHRRNTMPDVLPL